VYYFVTSDFSIYGSLFVKITWNDLWWQRTRTVPIPIPWLTNSRDYCIMIVTRFTETLNEISQLSALELCADELVVGGGVGLSYDRRRRRAAHFSSAAAASLYGRRRRRRRRRQTGWESTETAYSPDRRFSWFYRGQPLHLWSLLGRWRRKVNCEYACCAQFHSRNEFLEDHINAVLSVEGTLM